MTTKISNLHDLVMNYIHQFSVYGPEVVECFSRGMCYQFTLIMCARFGHSARRVYDPVINHFAVEIDGRIYDITGDITDNKRYVWEYWDTYQYKDSLHTKRIIRDCFRKIPSNVKLCEFCELVHEDDWGNISCSIDKRPKDANAICDKIPPQEVECYPCNYCGSCTAWLSAYEPGGPLETHEALLEECHRRNCKLIGLPVPKEDMRYGQI